MSKKPERVDTILAEIESRSNAENRAFSVSKETGDFLQFLVMILHARRVLDVGTGFGASAIYLGRALEDVGRVDSIEVASEHTQIAHNFLKRAGINSMVNSMEGDAREILPTLKVPYDLVFLDADLDIYCECLNDLIRLTRNQGVLVSDNMWDRETAVSLVGPVGVSQIIKYTNRLFSCRDMFSVRLNEEIIVSFKTSRSVAIAC